MFPFLQIPNWVIMLVALGFPIALIIAWAFELTPEGLKRTDAGEPQTSGGRGHLWIYVVVVGLGLSVGLVFLGRSMGRSHAPHSGGLSKKSLAVIPFENLSEDKANAYFADGMQDEIITRLAKIGELKVISRSSHPTSQK